MDNSIIEKINNYKKSESINVIYNKHILYNIYFKDYDNIKRFISELNKKIIESNDTFDIKCKLFSVGTIYEDYKDNFGIIIPFNYDILQFMLEYFNYISLN